MTVVLSVESSAPPPPPSLPPDKHSARAADPRWILTQDRVRGGDTADNADQHSITHPSHTATSFIDRRLYYGIDTLRLRLKGTRLASGSPLTVVPMHRINVMYDVAVVVRFIRWLLLYMQCTRTVFATKLLSIDHDHDEIKSKIER